MEAKATILDQYIPKWHDHEHEVLHHYEKLKKVKKFHARQSDIVTFIAFM